jgi:hypothetical protein
VVAIPILPLQFNPLTPSRAIAHKTDVLVSPAPVPRSRAVLLDIRSDPGAIHPPMGWCRGDRRASRFPVWFRFRNPSSSGSIPNFLASASYLETSTAAAT